MNWLRIRITIFKEIVRKVCRMASEGSYDIDSHLFTTVAKSECRTAIVSTAFSFFMVAVTQSRVMIIRVSQVSQYAFTTAAR
jgi:hypothetical protein